MPDIDTPINLVRALKERRAVLFAGAGLSLGAGLPDWKSMIAPLVDELKEQGIKNIPDDPLEIAEYYEIQFGRAQLEKNVRDIINSFEARPTPVHNAIVRLPWKAIITTNYDRVIEEALEEQRVRHEVMCLDKTMVFGSEGQVNLIKIHGDILRHGSIILSRSDYDEYDRNFSTVIRYIQGLVVNHVFLFVGFDLTDPNFQRIWNMVHLDLGLYGLRSFALMRQPDDLFRKRWARRNLDLLSFAEYADIPDFFNSLDRQMRSLETDDSLDETQLDHLDDLWRKIMEDIYKWIDPRGIFQFDKTIVRGDLELERIFVRPRLRSWADEKKGEAICKECGEPLQIVSGIGGKRSGRAVSSPESGRKMYACQNPECGRYDMGVYVSLAEIDESFPTGVVPVKDVLSKVKKTVIIGDPGVGKSTLLKSIALSAAIKKQEEYGINGEPLPFLIELRNYSAALAENRVAGLKEYLVWHTQEKLQNMDSGYVLDGFSRGRFLVLLDGLDEVDPARRRKVSDDVTNLISQYPECQWILTSRPAGYDAVRLVGDFPHYTLEPFDNDELKEFLKRWYEVFSGWDHTAWPDPDGTAEELHGVILSRDRIRAIAQNPLMATILVMVHNVGRRLPERRTDFYEAAIRTIAGTWEAWKFGAQDPNFPDVKDIFVALGEVAYRIHRTQEENIVPESRLKSWLAGSFRDRLGIDASTANREVDRFLTLIRERTGLLVEKGFTKKGEPLYGFVHLTFQEFLAARHLAFQAGRREWREAIRMYLHHTRWCEVFLLMVGMMGREDANEALNRIRNAGTEMEDILYRDIFFSARCLADDPEVDQEFGKEIVERLKDVVPQWQPDKRAMKAIERLLDLANLQSWRKEICTWLVSVFSDFQIKIKVNIISILAQYPVLKDNVYEIVLSSLKDCNKESDVSDWNMREAMVNFLKLIERAGEEERNLIKEWLKHPDSPVRISALEYFQAVRAGVEVSDARLLLEDADKFARLTAVMYFNIVKLAGKEELILIGKLLKDNEWNVRREAVRYFETVEVIEEEELSIIKDLLKDSYSSVREAVVKYFQVKGTGEDEERSAIRVLLGDSDNYVRRAAIDYFQEKELMIEEDRVFLLKELLNFPGKYLHEALKFFLYKGLLIMKEWYMYTKDILERSVQDNLWDVFKKYVRKAAIDYYKGKGVLSENECTDESMQNKYLQPIKDQEEHDLIKQSLCSQFTEEVAELLAYIRAMEVAGKKEHDLIKDLLTHDSWTTRTRAMEYFARKKEYDRIMNLIEDPEWHVRRSAVDIFRAKGGEGKESLFIKELLKKETDWSVRASAVDYFKGIGGGDEEVYDIIIKLLYNSEESDRRAAVEYFTAMGRGYEEEYTLICDLVKDSEKYVREAAIEYFISKPEIARHVAEKLEEYLKSERSAEIRDAVYDVMRAIPIRTSPLSQIEADYNPNKNTPSEWFPPMPPMTRQLIALSSNIETMCKQNPGLVPIGSRNIAPAHLISAFGEQLLKATSHSNPPTKKGTAKTLLSQTTKAIQQKNGIDPGQPSEKVADRILWSWRLACIYGRVFEPMVQISATRVPYDIRMNLASRYHIPSDENQFKYFLNRLEKEMEIKYNQQIPGCPRSWGSEIFSQHYVPDWEPGDENCEFYPSLITHALALTSANADQLKNGPNEKHALILSETSVITWLLRLWETLLEPWERLLPNTPVPSDILKISGITTQMGPDREKWVMDSQIRFVIDLRYREEIMNKASLYAPGWWENARKEFESMKTALPWFPEIEVEIRGPEKFEDGVLIKPAQAVNKQEKEETINIKPHRKDLADEIESLFNPGKAVRALTNLLEPFEAHRWDGPITARTLEAIETANLVSIGKTRKHTIELLCRLPEIVGKDDISKYLDLTFKAALNKKITVTQGSNLLTALADTLLREEVKGADITKYLELLREMAYDKKIRPGLRDAAMLALGTNYGYLQQEARIQLAAKLEQRLDMGRLDYEKEEEMLSIIKRHQMATRRR